jgi:hypothetical protein
MLTVLFVLLVIQVVIPYVFAPLLVFFVQKQTADSSFDRLSPDAFPPDMGGFLSQVTGRLASQGFTPSAYLRKIDAASGVVAHAMTLTNEATRESAAVIGVRSSKTPARAAKLHVEFCTEFVSGEEISTQNCSFAFITKPHPMRQQFRFPEVKDPLMLYGLHRQVVERHRPRSEPFVPTRGTEHLHAAHSYEKGMKRQEAFGYVYLDAASGAYRPTLKGAFLMSWKLVWPVKQLRESSAKRKAAELMRGMGR